jgi:hypothetical protein
MWGAEPAQFREPATIRDAIRQERLDLHLDPGAAGYPPFHGVGLLCGLLVRFGAYEPSSSPAIAGRDHGQTDPAGLGARLAARCSEYDSRRLVRPSGAWIEVVVVLLSVAQSSDVLAVSAIRYGVSASRSSVD